MSTFVKESVYLREGSLTLVLFFYEDQLGNVEGILLTMPNDITLAYVVLDIP
jgi:hypothetical protein